MSAKSNTVQTIKTSTNKNNVRYILPLLYWVIDKIQLIIKAEQRKQLTKECKQKNIKTPDVLKCSRGEVWETFLGYNIGSEQNGVNEKFSRPVLIIQNDNNNRKSPNTIVVPLSKINNRSTSDILSDEEFNRIKSELRKTEFLLNKNDVRAGEEELLYPSIVLCQNIKEISKERLDFKITHIKDECWNDINIAIKFALGIE